MEIVQNKTDVFYLNESSGFDPTPFTQALRPYYVIILMLCLFSVFCNFQNIAVFSHRNMSSVCYIYFKTLSISDIFRTFGHVWHLIEYATPNYILYTSYTTIWFRAHIIPYTVLNFVGISYIMTVCVSVDRYIAVCHPDKQKVTQNRRIAIFICVLFPTICSLFHLPWIFLDKPVVKFVDGKQIYSVQPNEVMQGIYSYIFVIVRECLWRYTPMISVAGLNARTAFVFQQVLHKRKTMNIKETERNKEDKQLITVLIILAIAFTIIAMVGTICCANIMASGFHSEGFFISYHFVSFFEVIDCTLNFGIQIRFNTNFKITWKKIFYKS